MCLTPIVKFVKWSFYILQMVYKVLTSLSPDSKRKEYQMPN